MQHAAVPGSALAIVTVIDAHSAVMNRYTGETLVHIRTIVAPATIGTSDHMGDSPRLTYHSGTRGETASAAKQRASAGALRDFVTHVSHAVAEAAATAEWIVIGGTDRDVRELEKALVKCRVSQPVVRAALHRGLAVKSVLARVAAAIAAERDVRELKDVETLLERTGAHTTGVVGAVASMDVAERGAAGAIFMTPRFQHEHPHIAQRLIGIATAHRGRVVTVANAGAELLDAQGGGVGALLRYAPYKAERFDVSTDRGRVNDRWNDS